jgi:DNA-binding transcriptional regulator YhcF (GntR family)
VSFIQEGEKMQGWIKLHRKVKSHWLFTEKRTFTKFEAWIDLLLEVNHKDNKFMLGNDLIEVKRGQTITSIRQLCERWNWSNSKVTKFLKMLESDEMLKVKSDTKKTVITIDNYDIYQVQDTEETTDKRHTHDSEATQKHTNKNDKNVKNEKKKNIYAEFVSMLPEEYEKLIQDFGQAGTDERVERLNLYKGSTGKKYKSDYLTILNWERKNNQSKPKSKKDIDWEGFDLD